MSLFCEYRRTFVAENYSNTMAINVVTQRFLRCFDKLVEQNVIRSSRQFAQSLNYLPQSFSEIKKERRDIPVEVLMLAVDLYRMNANYLFCGVGDMFASANALPDMKILTVVTDAVNNERIVHVPVTALAGYAQESSNPSYVNELPNFSLPDDKYRMGTFRSFDIEGDSMEPTLFEGDKVVCGYIEPAQWATNIKENHVYVLVTRGDTVVKRVKNLLRPDKHLLLGSDNSFYEPYRIAAGDVREVWYVRTKISPFLHSTPPSHLRKEEDFSHLQLTIAQQTRMISTLQSTIDKFMLGR